MGYPKCLPVLLAAGGDVNARNNQGQTPLHRATEVGDSEEIKVLLAAGGDVNARDDEGKTPLDYASLNDHSKAVQILIASGGIRGPVDG